MAKKAKRIPLAIVLPAVYPTIKAYQAAGGINEGMAKRMMQYYVGYNPDTNAWSFDSMKGFAISTLVGTAVHFTIGKKLNQYIPSYLHIGL